MGDLSRQRLWITGASSGIGAEVARQLARTGASLTLTARREDLLEEVAAQCRELGASDVVVAPADVTDSSEIARAYAAATAGGAVDIVLVNAGVWQPLPARSFSAEVVERTFNVNVVGAARCIEQVLPDMMTRGSGRIALVASLSSFAGLPLASAYGATKAALRSMGDSLRADLTGSGVGVTLIHPGFVRTPMTDVNDFHMAGIIEVDEAARRIVRALERERDEVAFPTTVALQMKFLGAAPGRLRRSFSATLVRRAARRPRSS